MSREHDYLAICAIYQNEGDYLQEFIAFHHAVGVERFYLYNDESTDNSREVLQPVIDKGLVVHHDVLELPGHAEARREERPSYHQQGWAYMHCLQTYGSAANWIAVIDVDEFLFAPGGDSVPEVLSRYEQWPGIVVNRATYGTSGHATEPRRLSDRELPCSASTPRIR